MAPELLDARWCNLFPLMSAQPLAALAEVLRNPDEVVDSWIRHYQASAMRMPGPVSAEELRALMIPIVVALAEGLYGPEQTLLAALRPGAAEMRELEKSVGFVAAALGNSGANGFDVAAFVGALRDALVPKVEGASGVGSYMEWLTALAVDSLGLARVNAERERIGEQLSDGMPLLQVVPGLPAVFLVAEPSRSVLDSVLGRLLLLCVRVGATAAIIDAHGLANQESPIVLEAVSKFLAHQRIAERLEVSVVGLGGDAEPCWSRIAAQSGCKVHFVAGFDIAVEWGLDASGYRLLKS